MHSGSRLGSRYSTTDQLTCTVLGVWEPDVSAVECVRPCTDVSWGQFYFRHIEFNGTFD